MRKSIFRYASMQKITTGSKTQKRFESGHEYGLRDKEFLDKGLYDILNFLLIYVKKGK